MNRTAKIYVKPMRYLVLPIACLLAACASTVVLQPLPASGVATVLGQMDRTQGLANWRSFALLAVDDKPIDHGFMRDARDTVVKVAPGERRFVVEAGFNAGFGGSGPWEAIVSLRAPVEAGKTYRLNGAVRDNLYFVWLEDTANGEKVLPEAAAPYRSSRSASTPIPIFIPAR